MYYPGEVICSNIVIKQLSICEHIIGKKTEQLLIRPIELYELPYTNSNSINSKTQKDLNSNFQLETKNIYAYKPNQILKGSQNLNLIITKMYIEHRFIKVYTLIHIINNLSLCKAS